MVRPPPRSTRPDPLFPAPTLFRSGLEERDRVLDVGIVAARGWRREEADVRQLRVVVHEVRTELGAAAEIFGVVLHRDAVLALVAGIPVALAIERAGGRRDQGQLIVELTFQGVGGVAVERTLRHTGRRADAAVDALATVSVT